MNEREVAEYITNNLEVRVQYRPDKRVTVELILAGTVISEDTDYVDEDYY